MYRVGVDLGGTNIVAGVINEEMKIVGRGKLKTNCPRAAEAILEDVAIWRHDQEVCDTAAVDYAAEADRCLVHRGQTCRRILVLDFYSEVLSGQTGHHIALDRQDVGLGAAQRIVSCAGDRCRAASLIPLDRDHLSGCDLVRGSTSNIDGRR